MRETLIRLGMLPDNIPVVLIVDDQPDNLQLLVDMLTPQYLVRVARSGPAAIDAAARPPYPDLVILDVLMPGMDGFETLQRLNSLATMRDVPTIFVTALQGESNEEDCFERGANDFISKPLRPHAVRARVKAQLDAHFARKLLKNRADALEVEVHQRLHDYHVVQDVALRALASLAETRDNETGNHILRTQAYVETLATQLASHPRFRQALTPDRVQHIVNAAPLHDIGKVGVPDAILLKPGPLTTEEMAIMRTHAQIGADALDKALQSAKTLSNDPHQNHTDLLFLETARDIALRHHERWDGTGYPGGLVGDAIPVSARLMALADVFDALVSRRVYKPPFPLPKVIALIHEARGSHFDPDVEAAFQATVHRFEAIALRYADMPRHVPAAPEHQHAA